MRGISEERLGELFKEYQHKFLSSQLEKMYEPHAIMNTLQVLLDECQELNQWQPIDENTPKDREIVVFAPGYQGLNPIITICKWHESAGFCIDELRQPTLWLGYRNDSLHQPIY